MNESDNKKDNLAPCPFCNFKPHHYTICERLSYGEKGYIMVKCRTNTCAIYDKAIYLDKWNHRQEVKKTLSSEKLAQFLGLTVATFNDYDWAERLADAIIANQEQLFEGEK